MRHFILTCFIALVALFSVPANEAKAQLALDIYSSAPRNHYGLAHHNRPRNYYAPLYRRAYAPHYRPLFRPAPVMPLINGPFSFGEPAAIRHCTLGKDAKQRRVRMCN
jgi:hypothetical protein